MRMMADLLSTSDQSLLRLMTSTPTCHKLPVMPPWSVNTLPSQFKVPEAPRPPSPGLSSIADSVVDFNSTSSSVLAHPLSSSWGSEGYQDFSGSERLSFYTDSRRADLHTSFINRRRLLERQQDRMMADIERMRKKDIELRDNFYRLQRKRMLLEMEDVENSPPKKPSPSRERTSSASSKDLATAAVNGSKPDVKAPAPGRPPVRGLSPFAMPPPSFTVKVIAPRKPPRKGKVRKTPRRSLGGKPKDNSRSRRPTGESCRKTREIKSSMDRKESSAIHGTSSMGSARSDQTSDGESSSTTSNHQTEMPMAELIASTEVTERSPEINDLRTQTFSPVDTAMAVSVDDTCPRGHSNEDTGPRHPGGGCYDEVIAPMKPSQVTQLADMEARFSQGIYSSFNSYDSDFQVIRGSTSSEDSDQSDSATTSSDDSNDLEHTNGGDKVPSKHTAMCQNLNGSGTSRYVYRDSCTGTTNFINDADKSITEETQQSTDSFTSPNKSINQELCQRLESGIELDQEETSLAPTTPQMSPPENVPSRVVRTRRVNTTPRRLNPRRSGNFTRQPSLTQQSAHKLKARCKKYMVTNFFSPGRLFPKTLFRGKFKLTHC